MSLKGPQLFQGDLSEAMLQVAPFVVYDFPIDYQKTLNDFKDPAQFQKLLKSALSFGVSASGLTGLR